MVTPVGFGAALPAFASPLLLGAGIAVGVCSSVIPYVCDQLAMTRLPRATFALMLSLLPATAVVIGVLVLDQVPTPLEAVGVVLIVAGVAVHQDSTVAGDEPYDTTSPPSFVHKENKDWPDTDKELPGKNESH